MTMLANTSLISCTFPLPLKNRPNFETLAQKFPIFPARTVFPLKGTFVISQTSPNTASAQYPCQKVPIFLTTLNCPSKLLWLRHHRTEIPHTLQICQNSINTKNSEDPFVEGEDLVDGEDGGSGGEREEWTTSVLLFLLWGGLIYYVFNLAPDQTPSRDVYFLKKLLNLKGDDGFRMNQVLVSLWYIMGLWPLTYSMLLLPTARSSKSKIPLWPFLILSCFGGAYALIPYFVLWKPPPPPVKETELGKWPLNFLDSKITAAISLATGLGLITYAGLAGGNDWKEFIQYFRESKFIHATSIDFTLLSTFAPFWVYNDMTARKWYEKGSWLIPLSLIPFLGPSLYILLRPSLDSEPVKLKPYSSED